MKVKLALSLAISGILLLFQIPLAMSDSIPLYPPEIYPEKLFDNSDEVSSPSFIDTSSKHTCPYLLPAPAVPNRPLDASPICVPAFNKFKSILGSGGSIPVIVRLKEPAEYASSFQFEGKLTELRAIEAQRAAILQVQDTLLKHISRKNAQNAKKFKHIPFMALTVDQAEFHQLLNAKEIDLIEEDVLVSLALSQSVPLIGANGNWNFSGFSGAGQTVAILDTGVDFTHSFLIGKNALEECFSTTGTFSELDSNNVPYTYNTTTVCPNGQTHMVGNGAGRNCTINGCDHGTHVAGIAAGKGNNFSGVARDANIFAIQVFSQCH